MKKGKKVSEYVKSGLHKVRSSTGKGFSKAMSYKGKWQPKFKRKKRR